MEPSRPVRVGHADQLGHAVEETHIPVGTSRPEGVGHADQLGYAEEEQSTNVAVAHMWQSIPGDPHMWQ